MGSIFDRRKIPVPLKRILRRARQLLVDSGRYVFFRFSDIRGVFSSFDEAVATMPRGSALGYDDEALAREYRANLSLELHSYDYPVLFHLDRLAREYNGVFTVFDYGGNVGVHLLRLRRYLDLSRVQWIVCDVPAIAAAGREVCAGIDNISFIDDIGQLNGKRVDVLLISNSPQYSVASPVTLLARLGSELPRHVLFDQIPLHDGAAFVTLQNGGLVYYPEYIFSKNELIRSFVEVGYRLADFWDCDQTSVVPFHPDKVITSNGMHLVLDQPTTASSSQLGI